MLLIYTLLIETSRFSFFTCLAVISTRLSSVTINKSAPSTLPCTGVPHLALVVAQQHWQSRGTAAPRQQNQPGSSSCPTPVSRVGQEKRHPLPPWEQLPGPSQPYATLAPTQPPPHGPWHNPQWALGKMSLTILELSQHLVSEGPGGRWTGPPVVLHLFQGGQGSCARRGWALPPPRTALSCVLQSQETTLNATGDTPIKTAAQARVVANSHHCIINASE